MAFEPVEHLPRPACPDRITVKMRLCSGKSLPMFRNVPSPQYIAFTEMQIMAFVASSLPTRGAFRDRYDLLAGAVEPLIANVER